MAWEQYWKHSATRFCGVHSGVVRGSDTSENVLFVAKFEPHERVLRVHPHESYARLGPVPPGAVSISEGQFPPGMEAVP